MRPSIDQMIARLRTEFEKIKLIDPESPTYGRLSKLLDSMPTVELERLAAANIKWVSMLANNRLIKRSGLR